MVHRVLQLLIAADIPFRCLHRGVAKQKLNLFQFASGAVAQAGASAAEAMWCEMIYAGLFSAPLHCVPDHVCYDAREL